MTRLSWLAGAAAALALAAAAPAIGAQISTDALVANLRPNVDFLDRSSRLALDKSSNPAVLAFARNEALQQTVTANSLVAWTQSHTAEVAPLDGVPIPALFDAIVAAPASVAQGVGTDAEALATGRSVAIDNAPAAPVPRNLLPSGDENMVRLQGLSGHRFDGLYRSTQLDSLRQVWTLYRAYAENGEDAALRALSQRELPRINARILELRKF